jgi:hypothetical protein
MIKKYLNFFDKGRIERGEKLYNNSGVKKAIKYKNIYNFKVSGNYENYYNVNIGFEDKDDINLNCNCEDSTYCKHLFASLLFLDNNICEILNLDNLTQIELENILDHLIMKDSSTLWTILNYKKKNNKTLKNKKENIKKYIIEKFKLFFKNFENEEYENLIDDKNYNYEYCEDIFEKYDDELINLLKNYNDNDDIIEYVKKKITEYNDYLYNNDSVEIFTNTIKYLSDPNNYVGINDIIILFKIDYNKAVLELEKITDGRKVYNIFSKIKPNKKTNLLLLNKIDYYISKNEMYNYIFDMIILLIKNTKDVKIKKKYGLIFLEYNYSFEIFTKIKLLCSDEEIEKLCENMSKVSNMSDDVFNILYDLKKYDEICEILGKNYIMNINQINNFFELIIKNKVDKTVELIKNNITYILDNTISHNYDCIIEYLKIMKNNIELNSFDAYTNKLLKKYSSKSKFKRLYIETFIN